MAESYRTSTFPLPGLDLDLTLAPLCRGGPTDPTFSAGTEGVWRASRTPEGPATTHLREDSGQVVAEAWGPGADWAIANAPALVGTADRPEEFVPHHPLMAELTRIHAGLRIMRTNAVFEALLPTILDQKVPGVQARWAYAELTRTLGEPAPGPMKLLLPPSPAALAVQPYWFFHRFGIERRRAETVRIAASYAHRLEETLRMTLPDAYRRLTALPGVGPWSAAEVGQIALGDRDAVSVGDYHLPNLVSWAFTGEPRGNDERMLELLEPYRGHRARVIRLLLAGGIQAPRFGPRMPLRWIAHH